MGGLGPGIGGAEWLVLGVVALLVVGPERLPGLLRELGKWVAKARGMASEFRNSFEDMARQSELDELRKEVQALRSTNPIDLGSDAEATFRDIKSEFQRPLFDTVASGDEVSPLEPADPEMTPAPTEWPVDTGVVVDTTTAQPGTSAKKRASRPKATDTEKANRVQTTKPKAAGAQRSKAQTSKAPSSKAQSPKQSEPTSPRSTAKIVSQSDVAAHSKVTGR